MMRLRLLSVYLSFIMIFFVSFTGFALSSGQQDALSQFVADLQKNPDAPDVALVEKIIRLAQEMTPAPAIPAEAVKFADRGEYAAKSAKTESDFADAAEEYKKAMLIAPWVAEYWFNLGVLREKANQPQRAVNGFKLYLLAEPNAKDAREVQKRIAGLEYAAEKAAKGPSPGAIVAKKEDAYEVWIKGLDGARFICAMPGANAGPSYNVYFIEGNKVHNGWFDSAPADFKTSPIRREIWSDNSWSLDIHGKQFTVPQPSFFDGGRPFTATISDDGQFISFDRGTSVYKRVK